MVVFNYPTYVSKNVLIAAWIMKIIGLQMCHLSIVVALKHMYLRRHAMCSPSGYCSVNCAVMHHLAHSSYYLGRRSFAQ